MQSFDHDFLIPNFLKIRNFQNQFHLLIGGFKAKKIAFERFLTFSFFYEFRLKNFQRLQCHAALIKCSQIGQLTGILEFGLKKPQRAQCRAILLKQQFGFLSSSRITNWNTNESLQCPKCLGKSLGDHPFKWRILMFHFTKT